MNQSDGYAPNPDVSLSLIMAARRVEDRLEKALADHGLSLAKQNVLSILVDAGAPLSLGEIANRLNCVRSNVTQLVDRLEADGLVQRQPSPADRRSVTAVATEAGIERQAAGARALASAQDEISQALAPFDTAHIEDALRSL
jgi:DNA-binding MarR family transcriptional regulator